MTGVQYAKCVTVTLAVGYLLTWGSRYASTATTARLATRARSALLRARRAHCEHHCARMPLHTSEMTDEMLMALSATRAEHASQQRDRPPAALSPAEQRLIENRRQRELADAELPAATGSRQLGWMLHRGGRRSTARSASPPERRRRRPLSADASATAEPAVGERRALGESLKKVLWLERQRQQQAHELRRTFGLPSTEEPLDDFSCALQKAILLHGRLFVSRQHVCFSSNVFGVRTQLALPFREVVSVSKGTQSLINPSIVVMTKAEQHIFASFWKRDNAFNLLLGAWTAFHDQLWLERAGDSGSAAPPAAASSAAAAAAAAAAPAANLPSSALAVAAATAAPLEHEVRLDGGGGDGGLAAAAGGGRGTGRVLGCALVEVEAALLADSSPFLAELKAAQGGSAISVGAWQGFAGGGRVREVRFVQPVRA